MFRQKPFLSRALSRRVSRTSCLRVLSKSSCEKLMLAQLSERLGSQPLIDVILWTISAERLRKASQIETRLALKPAQIFFLHNHRCLSLNRKSVPAPRHSQTFLFKHCPALAWAGCICTSLLFEHKPQHILSFEFVSASYPSPSPSCLLPLNSLRPVCLYIFIPFPTALLVSMHLCRTSKPL